MAHIEKFIEKGIFSPSVLLLRQFTYRFYVFVMQEKISKE